MERFQLSRERFERARREALRQDLTGLLTGGRRDLLPFAPFERYLNTYSRIEHRTAESIPLDKIVGSVGRYTDFTRSFLPRNQAMLERWAFVQQRMTSMEGLPPIEVFKVGEVYFVSDGNHRVSSARVNGFREIEAYVTEYPVDPGLEPGDSLDAALAKAGRAHFMKHSGLDAHAPAADITLTLPGGYHRLIEHIEIQRLLMQEAEPGRAVTMAEAALAWCDESYLPVVEAIRRHDLLRTFHGRTEADLYVWIWGVLYQMHQIFGEEIDAEEGAALLELRREVSGGGRLHRLLHRLRGQPEDHLPDWVEDALG